MLEILEAIHTYPWKLIECDDIDMSEWISVKDKYPESKEDS